MKVEKGPGFEQLQVLLKNLHGKTAKVGWLDGAGYANGETYASVAVKQEFGVPAGRIPPRPFMSTTISEKEQEWRVFSQRLAKSLAKGAITIEMVMEQLGQRAAGDVRKKIASITEPTLAKSTIQARLERRANKKKVGNLTKPLIDTGQLIGSLTNSVEDDAG